MISKTISRTLPFILLVNVLALMPSIQQTEVNSPYLATDPEVIPSQYGPPIEFGVTFDVKIQINDLQADLGCYNVVFDLNYNATILQIISCTATPLWQTHTVNYTMGIVHVDVKNPASTPNGSVPIGTARFNVTMQGVFPTTLESRLNFTNITVLGTDGEIVTDHHDGLVQITPRILGRRIDVFTQRGGIGPNFWSEDFYLMETVTLYANVAYTDWPEAEDNVAFQLIDPHGVTCGVVYGRTNATGTAVTRFALPYTRGYYFGNWTVVATLDLASVIVNDTLEFEYSVRDHDIGIMSLAVEKTILQEGLCLPINITIFNYGNRTEDFNVTLQANDSTIDQREVVLASEDFANLTFNWNTTGLAYGNYTISAYAWPVLGETDVANNNFTGGVVTVTIPGDINGDFTVEIYDALILAGAYNSRPNTSNWNINADANSDNIVDIYDAIILANNYGRSA